MARTPHAQKPKLETHGATVIHYWLCDDRGHRYDDDWYLPKGDPRADSRIRRVINGVFEVRPGARTEKLFADVYCLAHVEDIQFKRDPQFNGRATRCLELRDRMDAGGFPALTRPVLGPAVLCWPERWRRITIRHPTGANPFEKLEDACFSSDVIRERGARTSYFYFNLPEEEPTFLWTLR